GASSRRRHLVTPRRGEIRGADGETRAGGDVAVDVDGGERRRIVLPGYRARRQIVVRMAREDRRRALGVDGSRGGSHGDGDEESRKGEEQKRISLLHAWLLPVSDFRAAGRPGWTPKDRGNRLCGPRTMRTRKSVGFVASP